MTAGGGYSKYLATGNERQVCNGEGHTVFDRDRDCVLELGYLCLYE